MNIIKKAFVVASAAVMCAIPLAPSVADNTTFFSSNSITASAANYTTDYNQYSTPKRADGYYNPNYSYSEVKWIQAAYNKIISTFKIDGKWESKIAVDGYYGQQTRNAVKLIQRCRFKWNGNLIYGSIAEDGYCGKDTTGKMQVLVKY